MKNALIATVATLAALSLGAGAHAQQADAKKADAGAMKMAGGMMSDWDAYKAAWAFRNLDARDMARYRARGFSEDTIKGAANIALRTGVTTDYVLNRTWETGMPLTAIASQFGLATTVINDEIPMMGAATAPSTPMKK